MTKNILIAVLVVLVLGMGAYIFKKRSDMNHLLSMMAQKSQTVKTTPGMPPKPASITKGMKVTDPAFVQFATKIAPGDLSADAKTAMNGWTITSKAQTDGSLVVSLVPTDSADQSQQYTLKKGESLYFVDLTPLDDKTTEDKDLNYRDDYGVIVDANGIVQ